MLRFQAGDAKAAEGYNRRALDMRRELLGSAHPEIAQTASNLGLLLQEDGRADEAEALLREALQMRRALLDPGDPRIGQSLNNLALLLGGQGQRKEAQTLLREGLALLQAALGKGHPMVATNLDNLATVLARGGELAKAERLYTQALAMRRTLLPTGHPHLAYSLLGLGTILCERGDARGQGLLHEAMVIRRVGEVTRRAARHEGGAEPAARARGGFGAQVELGEQAALGLDEPASPRRPPGTRFGHWGGREALPRFLPRVSGERAQSPGGRRLLRACRWRRDRVSRGVLGGVLQEPERCRRVCVEDQQVRSLASGTSRFLVPRFLVRR